MNNSEAEIKNNQIAKIIEDLPIYMFDFGLESQKMITRFRKEESMYNSLSLKEFIEMLIKSYKYFKEDYEKIEDLRFGSDFNVVKFIDCIKYSEVIIKNDLNSIDEIRFVNDNEYYEAYLSANEEKQLDINPDIVKNYIDIFVIKYGSLFEMLKNLRSGLCFCETYSNVINITPEGSDSNLEGINLCLSFLYEPVSYYLKIFIDINTGEIDYNRSNLEINGLLIPVPRQILLSAICSIYGKLSVSRDLLKHNTQDFEEFCDWIEREKRRENGEKRKHLSIED